MDFFETTENFPEDEFILGILTTVTGQISGQQLLWSALSVEHCLKKTTDFPEYNTTNKQVEQLASWIVWIFYVSGVNSQLICSLDRLLLYERHG